MGDFLTYPMRNDGIRVIPPVSDDNLVDSLIQWEGFLPHPKDIGDGKIALGSGLTDPRWHRLYRERGDVWSKEDNRNAVAVEVAKRRKILEGLVPHWEEIEPETQKAFISYYYNYPFSRENSPKMFEAFDRRDFREAVNQMNATSSNPTFKRGLEIRREKERRWGHASLDRMKNNGIEKLPIGSTVGQIFKTVNNAIRQVTPHGAGGRWSEGGSLGNPWDGLSLQEKAEMMKVAVRNGITDLKTIKEKYNEFAEGGDTKQPVTTGGAGYIPDNYGWDAIDYTRRKLYDNVIPFGYNNPLQRVYNGVVLDKKEQYDPAYRVSSDTAETLDDIWGQYLSIPKNKRHKIHSSNGIVRSAGPDNKEYWQLKNLDPIIDEVVNTGLGWEERVQKIPGESPWVYYHHEPIKLGERVQSKTQNQILGEYQIGRGFDNRGEYLYYQDTWDINPFQKTTNQYGQDKPNDDGLVQKVFRAIAPKNGDATFGIGTPVNIFGKIYLDDIYGVPKPTHATYLPEVTVYGNKKSDGGPIHIKPENRGKFTALKERTGHSATWFKEHGTPAQKKMATFALNARHWKHGLGGPLVEAANIYDGTTENSQQMNIMAYHPAEDYYTGPSAVMPEINVTRKKDGKTYVGLGDFSDRYDRKKRPYFVSSRTGQLTAANAAKAWDAMVTPALSWALPNVFRGIDAAQRGDAVGVGKEALKAAGLKVAGTVAANPSLAAPGSAFWMNPMTKQIAAGTAASEGVNLATNVLTPYNTWSEGVSDVVNQATGWNPQDSWWGQTMAEATNPGWLVNPSRVMGAVDRVGSAVENGVKTAYDNGTLWDAYTTFGGRFGNYGDNLATNIYGTAARRFGLPDKARVPADAMRKIKGDVHVDNGVVDLTGNKPYLGNPHVNATLDRGVVSHSKGAWDGANTYITPTRNFLEQTQGSLKSIEPSDMFSNGARVTEAPQNVTLISGDVASLNKAREAGMQTLSSPRLRRIYQEEEAKYLAEKAAFDEQYANASGIQRLMLKAPESPKSKKWWPEYTKEVQRLQAQRGTPTLSDFRLLEEQTGLSSGTAPVSEMQNAVRQLEAMQNASISDIEAGRVQPYVYPNGRVVDWDKVAEELALIKRAKYNKVFYDPASYVESDWQVANGVK